MTDFPTGCLIRDIDGAVGLVLDGDIPPEHVCRMRVWYYDDVLDRNDIVDVTYTLDEMQTIFGSGSDAEILAAL